MKSLLVFISAFLFSLSLSAQWNVGPKVSYGTIVQKTESFRIFPNSEHGLYDLSYEGSSAVNSMGFMAYRDLGPIFLQAEVLASKYDLNFKMDRYQKLDIASPIYSETHYLIELPLAAGLLYKNVKIGLGPVLDYNVEKDSQFSQFDYYKNTSDKVEFGFQWMLGYNLGIFHIDVKYVNKFNSIADGFQFGDDDMKLQNSANRVSLSLGVTL